MRMGMSPSAQSAQELTELSVAAERAIVRGGALEERTGAGRTGAELGRSRWHAA